MRIIEVIVPQLGVNDETVLVTQWLIQPGAPVRRGQIIAVIESTKAAFEVEAEYDGYCYPLAREGERVSIRAVIALITERQDAAAATRYTASRALPAQDSSQTDRMTHEARRLVKEHGVNPSLLPADRIVRAKDVRALLEGGILESPRKPDSASGGLRRVAIYGASQGGLTVMECLAAMGGAETVCFLDDRPELICTDYCGIPVRAGDELDQPLKIGLDAVATHIADSRVRLTILDRARRAGIASITIIHPNASVAPSACLGDGCLVKAGAVIDSHVHIGDCCIIDNSVVLPHHNRIGAGCHLAPGACFGGDCEVGAGTVIGIGAVISARVSIGVGVIVGAGSCVCRDLPDGVVVEGNPARIIGERRLG